MQLHGAVERVTYHNPETGYCVLKIKADDQSDFVTVVGFASKITPGESIEAQGAWINHKDFGPQFKAESLTTVFPSSVEGLEKYLGSGMVKGIGPHFARKLIEAFGSRVLEIIEKEPERLRKIPGIGEGRMKQVTSSWNEQRVVREIMVFLQSHGVSTSRAVRIFRSYGENAIDVVKANPYRLAREIYGIGFLSSDLIASHLGIPKDSLLRAGAGLGYLLVQRIAEGNCAYPEAALVNEAVILLEIPVEILLQAVKEEAKVGHLVQIEIEGMPCLSPKDLHHSEKNIAERLLKMSRGFPPWKQDKVQINSEKAVARAQADLGIELAALQKEAILKVLGSKVVVVTGGPGTGKTTLTKAVLKALKDHKLRIALCSPTGRAARRLSECTGLEAKTIHRLLGFGRHGSDTLPEFNAVSPLPVDFLILDEASMVDVPLMALLLAALPPQAALLIVGDADQLPSVGPGRVLASLINSNRFEVVRLSQVFRQAAESRIISSAHQINRGVLPELQSKNPGSDFHFVSSESPRDTISKVIEMVKNRIPARFGLDPIKDIQVLSPMNRGELGTRALNSVLQHELNPFKGTTVERFGYTYAPGDKVMITTNDYDKDIFNGDIGRVSSIDPDAQELRVDFDGREVIFDFGELDLLSLAYAKTIHKSQGSEYPAVVIVLSLQHRLMLKRNLIYTGVTRGKRLVVVVGQRAAFTQAIQSPDQGKRWSALPDLLKISELN